MNVSGENNLCFFQCLAVHRGGDRGRYERDAQKLFNNYCMLFEITYNAFTGVNLSDFIGLRIFSKFILLFMNWRRGLLNWFNVAVNYILKQ